MNTQLQTLINRQHQRMRELREDASDLANTVADEVWDKFEVEIDEATADGFMFDFASSTQASLSSTLAMCYDEAFERHVLGLLEKLANELQTAGADPAHFAHASIDLTGLRKTLKLRRHANEQIGLAIARAKPGLIGMLFLAQDPCSEAWDREHRDNAHRLRRHLLGLRDTIMAVIREETTTVIQTARLRHIGWLDSLSNQPHVQHSQL